ncbi:MAG TPA: conjugal transfer protein [Solirubrobacteraceae bacterium]|nr:conjugal transfer protein [Solirubrobacteraceae bacterium]
MSITAQTLWRIRLRRGAPRYMLGAVSLAGVVASARFALDPPTPTLPMSALHAPAPPDRAAEGYAALFARRYLSWDAAEPRASEQALEPFLGAEMEAGAGVQLPEAGSQRVDWDEVVQAREPARGEHVYTVAAQTDTGGLMYLTVGVTRTRDGRLALSGYPAFVGAPAAVPASHPRRLREVSDPTLATVARRALRNYLSATPADLAADLASGARVSFPAPALSLQTVQRLDWSADGSSVLALVQARDPRGTQYTLAYEVEVERAQGRWEVSAVQMDPDA